MADRETMLKQINEISFTVNDLTLFLDTLPALLRRSYSTRLSYSISIFCRRQ